MNQENKLRYSIKMKKVQKIFNLIISLLMLIPSIMIMALQIFFYKTERETEFPVFLGTLIFPIIFLIFGICGIAAAVKKVDIYKGKFIVHYSRNSNTTCLILKQLKRSMKKL